MSDIPELTPEVLAQDAVELRRKYEEAKAEVATLRQQLAEARKAGMLEAARLLSMASCCCAQRIEDAALAAKAAPCANCGHSDPHTSPAGEVADACGQEGCECGYYAAKPTGWRAYMQEHGREEYGLGAKPAQDAERGDNGRTDR